MTEEDKKAWGQFLERGSLTMVGKIILATGAARWYRDGTFFLPIFKMVAPCHLAVCDNLPDNCYPRLLVY